MINKINNKDYTKILKFYNIQIPKSKKMLKYKANKIISQKLCRCIKKIGLQNEAKSIGICTKSIFNTKGYTRGKFKCKDRQYVTFRRSSNTKTRKNIL